MNTNNRLTDAEYADLCIEYELNSPKLSGKSGFITTLKEKSLVKELLSPEYARIVNAKAHVMSLSPSEIIQELIKEKMVENV